MGTQDEIDTSVQPIEHSFTQSLRTDQIQNSLRNPAMFRRIMDTIINAIRNGVPIEGSRIILITVNNKSFEISRFLASMIIQNRKLLSVALGALITTGVGVQINRSFDASNSTSSNRSQILTREQMHQHEDKYRELTTDAKKKMATKTRQIGTDNGKATSTTRQITRNTFPDV